MKEMINHPDHYKGAKFEVIDIIDDFELNFNLGNAIKYILRAGKKDNKAEDLKKALWYVEREIKKLGLVKYTVKDMKKDFDKLGVKFDINDNNSLTVYGLNGSLAASVDLDTFKYGFYMGVNTFVDKGIYDEVKDSVLKLAKSHNGQLAL